ncbi:MAG: DUF4832 domain-containing protein [Lentisphaerae bacterium]|nr:DUF4832 domain-containing protein [Lentisphaerota bacterium]
MKPRLAILLTSLSMVVAAQADSVTATFADNGKELSNPGMGFVFHFYDNSLTNYGNRTAPEDLLDAWPGLTQIYLRIPWSVIEPEEGKFEWSVLDTPMQRYQKRGLKASFRISCSETGFKYATPKWVQDAGAKGYYFRPGQGIVEDGTHWEPDFGDPIFLEKLDNLLAKLAARYDGHPDVELFDIGSFGTWGEGHTWTSTRLEYPNEVILKHVELYAKHFKKTIVLAQDDFLSRPGFKTPKLVVGSFVDLTFDLVIPKAWHGKSFVLASGFYRGNPYARLNGWKHNPNFENKSPIAFMDIDENGVPTVRANPEMTFPEGNAFPEDCPCAAKLIDFDYDRQAMPYSAKIKASYWKGKTVPDGFHPFLDILSSTGQFIVGLPREAEDQELVDAFARHKMGLRDDSILVSSPPRAYFHAKAAQQLWPNAPIYIESEHVGGSIRKNCWEDGHGFFQSIVDYHASYASIHWWPDEFLADWRELIKKINLVIGFRFLPTKVTFQNSVSLREGTLEFETTWQNRGVAPAYKDYFPIITLKNKNGGVAAVLVDDAFNLRNLPVSVDQSAKTLSSKRTIKLPPNISAGTYDVMISVGDELGKPIIELPIDGNDGNRRYKVGTLSIAADYSANATSVKLDGNLLSTEMEWTIHRKMDGVILPFIHLQAPSGHLSRVGQTSSKDNFLEPGKHTSTGQIELPVNDDKIKPKDGEIFSIWVGLWWPAKVAMPDERLLPDDGVDKRIKIAELLFKDGSWTLLPKQ